MATGENRLELLLVEAQEERERIVHALLLLLGVAVFGLLAAAALTGAMVVWLWLWEYSRVASLLAVTGVYAGASLWFGWRLSEHQSEGSLVRVMTPSRCGRNRRQAWMILPHKGQTWSVPGPWVALGSFIFDALVVSTTCPGLRANQQRRSPRLLRIGRR